MTLRAKTGCNSKNVTESLNLWPHLSDGVSETESQGVQGRKWLERFESLAQFRSLHHQGVARDWETQSHFCCDTLYVKMHRAKKVMFYSKREPFGGPKLKNEKFFFNKFNPLLFSIVRGRGLIEHARDGGQFDEQEFASYFFELRRCPLGVIHCSEKTFLFLAKNSVGVIRLGTELMMPSYKSNGCHESLNFATKKENILQEC